MDDLEINPSMEQILYCAQTIFDNIEDKFHYKLESPQELF